MRRPFQLTGLAFAGALALAGGCAAPKSAESPGATAPPKSAAKPAAKGRTAPAAEAAAPTVAEQIEQRAQALAHFAAGVSLELQDKTDAALDEFMLAAISDPANEELVLDVARRLLRKRNEPSSDKALALLRRAASQPTASAAIDALLGVALAQAGRLDEALAASRTAIKKDPQHFQGWQNAAQVHLQANRPHDALKVIDDAAKIARGLGPLTDLADLYGTWLRANAKQLEVVKPRILAVIEDAVKLQPSSPAIIQRLAENYRLAGEFGKAADLYSGLLKRFPDQPALRERLIDLYLRSNDHKAATAQLEGVLRQNPNNPQAHFFLGAIAHEQKEYDKAVNLFERALRLDPAMEQAYWELVSVRFAQDKSKEVLEVLARARTRFPNSFILEFYSGLAHSRLKDYAKSVTHLTTAEAIAKKDDPTRLTHLLYFQLGAAHERNKNVSEAERHFEQCLKLQPDFAEALNYLGYMWAERGVNLDRAKTMIEQAVKQDPENAAFLDSLGWVFFKLGKHKEALEWLQKSAQHLKEPDATIFDHIGDVFLALNQPAKARENWTKALSIEPDNADIKKKLEAPGKK